MSHNFQILQHSTSDEIIDKDNFDSDSRPKTSDNRLKAGNDKRLQKDKGMAVSRSIGTFGI